MFWRHLKKDVTSFSTATLVDKTVIHINRMYKCDWRFSVSPITYRLMYSSCTQRGVLTEALRLKPDHSLVSISARFTVLWRGLEALWNSLGTKWQSLKPQNPQGIKALSVRASGGSWQDEMNDDSMCWWMRRRWKVEKIIVLEKGKRIIWPATKTIMGMDCWPFQPEFVLMGLK